MGYGDVTVTTANTLIVAANAKRKVLTFTNISEAIPIFIGPDALVTTSNSVPLYENQTKDNFKAFGYYLGPIYGMAKGGTANVRYWEME